MRTIVVSDLHLGSRHSRAGAFLEFLAGIPEDATLVLNGDTVDRRRAVLPPEHARVLELLGARSERSSVIVTPGNHDDGYRLPNPRRIQFLPDYAIGKRLYVAHGHTFDRIMPANRPLLYLLRLLHELRPLLGDDAMHVAEYAKRVPWLYQILCRSIRRQAAQYARKHGFEAVTCGHTHYAEDSMEAGVRYLNTGAWTEAPMQYLDVTEDAIQLRPFPATAA